jgi:hypothetical protein
MEEKKVNGLEDKLAGMLRPVAPRREFVRGLGSRIQSLRRTVTKARSDTWQFILLALAGILSIGVLVAVAGRALYNLLGVRKQQSREM